LEAGVSQQDVELVRSLVVPAEVDWAEIMRDEEMSSALDEQTRDSFDPSFECALVGVTEIRRPGFDGLRKIWLDWLEPWTTYRAEEDEIVDLGGGRVLWLGRDYGGKPDGREVELISSAIWTVTDGRVAEIVFYATRDDALAAAAALGDESVPHRVLADDAGLDELK
jgi:ketosteroid isomerase-like protein